MSNAPFKLSADASEVYRYAHDAHDDLVPHFSDFLTRLRGGEQDSASRWVASHLSNLTATDLLTPEEASQIKTLVDGVMAVRDTHPPDDTHRKLVAHARKVGEPRTSSPVAAMIAGVAESSMNAAARGGSAVATPYGVRAGADVAGAISGASLGAWGGVWGAIGGGIAGAVLCTVAVAL